MLEYAKPCETWADSAGAAMRRISAWPLHKCTMRRKQKFLFTHHQKPKLTVKGPGMSWVGTFQFLLTGIGEGLHWPNPKALGCCQRYKSLKPPGTKRRLFCGTSTKSLRLYHSNGTYICIELYICQIHPYTSIYTVIYIYHYTRILRQKHIYIYIYK